VAPKIPTPPQPLDAICQRGTALLPSADWKRSKISIKVCDKLCTPKQYRVMFDNPSDHGRTAQRFIMLPCIHNDVVGLSNRYLKKTDNDYRANDKIVNSILDELANAMRKSWVGPKNLTDVLECKSSGRIRRYHNAANDVYNNGFNIEKHSKVSAFIKNEVYDECKPPRMIMGRDPRFNLLYAQFTEALEKCMTELPEVSKGKNFVERGKQFMEKIFGAWILEIDCSKFEATQRLALLKRIELGLAKRLMTPSEYQVFKACFIAKMRKDGWTLNNVHFEFWECRGTGDPDTGLFNTLITWVACRYFEIINGTGNTNFICDGDDNLIRIPVGAKYVNTFSEFGLDAKLQLRHDYHDAEYCSGKFIQVQPGVFHYVQNIHKMMQNLPVFRKTKFDHCKATYYHSLGYMYKVLYPKFPLFENIAGFLIRSAPNEHVSVPMLREINPSHTEAFKHTQEKIEIDVELVRVEIAMSFNLTFEELKRVCQWYDDNTIVLKPDECKRYNPEKPPANRLTDTQIKVVDQILWSSAQNHKFSKMYQQNIIAFLEF